MAEFPRMLAKDEKDKEISVLFFFFNFFFSLKPEDSLHDFPTQSFQAAILLTIHMEMEGSGGADSHITLICP